MNIYFIEVTDTFGGQANYGYVTRFALRAKSVRGAILRLARTTGLNWRYVADYGDQSRYDTKSGNTCAFVELFDDAIHGQYRLAADDR